MNQSKAYQKSMAKRLQSWSQAWGLLLALVVLLLQASPLVQDWDQILSSRFLGLQQVWQGSESGPGELVVVRIGEDSLPASASRHPLDRVYLAQVLRSLAEQQPRLVVLDLELDRPSSPEADHKLLQAMTQLPNLVVKSDPLDPILPLFAPVVAQTGAMAWKLDSSGQLQSVCNQSAPCGGLPPLHQRLAQELGWRLPQSPWLRINFVAPPSPNQTQKLDLLRLEAKELGLLAPNRLKGKVVLLGVDLPSIYSRYQSPLAGVGPLSELEALVQVALTLHRGDALVDVPWWVLGVILLLVYGVFFLGLARWRPLSLIMLLVGLMGGWFALAALLQAALHLVLPYFLPLVGLVVFCWGGLALRLAGREFANLQLELALKQGKLEFLTNELHAHHLFNEFSRLSVMIRQDPKAARDYLVEFAEMLRASLQYGDQRQAPLRVQVDYLNNYLAQQQILFGEAFQVNFMQGQVDQNLTLPWHCLFPLVENGVKHLLQLLQDQVLEQVQIKLELASEGRHLVFFVENNFDPAHQPASAGKGLANLQDRLAWYFPQGGWSLTGKAQGQVWMASLKIPLDSTPD